MALPNVSTLLQRINKGAEGGHEFARIINQLLHSESTKEDFQFISHSDAIGDYKGVDGIIIKGVVKTGLQYKFIPSSFKSDQKSQIKSSLENALSKFQDMDQWILVIPEEPNKNDLQWIDELTATLKISVQIWGHSKILNLMLKHKHIGELYYTDLPYAPIRAMDEPSLIDLDFFKKFLGEDADINLLLLQSQPTLQDCKAVFSQSYYKEVSDTYYLQYRNLYETTPESNSFKTKKVVEIKSSNYDDIVKRQHELPGGMHMIEENYKALNKATRFYSVHFKDEGAEYGVTTAVWCFINGRWVFFPKPHRVVSSIEAMRKDKELKFMIKVFKWLGFHKILQKEYKNKSILAVNHIINKLTSN